MGELFKTEKLPITDLDRMRLGASLAITSREIIATKTEKSDVTRTYRVKIRALEEQADTLSQQLVDGFVEHKFEVEEVPDDWRQAIQILRKATQELMGTRPMNEAEKESARKRRQGSLFDGNAEAEQEGEVIDIQSARAKADEAPPATVTE